MNYLALHLIWRVRSVHRFRKLDSHHKSAGCHIFSGGHALGSWQSRMSGHRGQSRPRHKACIRSFLSNCFIINNLPRGHTGHQGHSFRDSFSFMCSENCAMAQNHRFLNNYKSMLYTSNRLFRYA
jgi:hypothetical protein